MRLRLSHLGLLTLTVWALAQAGCNMHQEPPKPPEIYTDLGYKPHLPEFMRGTIYERTEVANDTPYPLTAYSLVVNLQGTGDNSGLPQAVRQSLIKWMTLAGFGQVNDPHYTNLRPDDVLNDPRVSVVQVEGRLPVGARQGQRFDVIVRAMPHSNTTSLAHGRFYRTDLYERGLEEPQGHADVLAYADTGDVFVNPSFALLDGPQPTDITASLRKAVVMGSGVTMQDRPIFLQLRVPEARLARAIELRVTERFQAEKDRSAAAAEDPGIVALYVPMAFNGDWQHFLQIVNHLYLDSAPDVNVRHARQLVLAARQPNAPLTDISYCLEGMGPTAVPLYMELIQDPSPDIAYCGARAAASVGDQGAVRALVAMAIDSTCPYQVASVHALGQLPQAPEIDRELEGLLSSDQRLIRIEAYKILAAHDDRLIEHHDINGHFWLDWIDCKGPPLIYATVEGLPRLAVFGDSARLTTPITYLAMNHRFSITSDDTNPDAPGLTMFYRDPERKDPVRIVTKPTVVDLIARLGGIGPPDEDQMNFSYGDVVAILQSLSDAHCLMGVDDLGNEMVTTLMLEPPPELQQADEVASLGTQRPQGGPPPASDPMLPPGHTAPAPGADSIDTSSPQAEPSPGGSNSTPVPSFGP